MIDGQTLSLVADFCDWLDKTLSEENSDADFIDYAYNTKRFQDLPEYAKKYSQDCAMEPERLAKTYRRVFMYMLSDAAYEPDGTPADDSMFSLMKKCQDKLQTEVDFIRVLPPEWIQPFSRGPRRAFSKIAGAYLEQKVAEEKREIVLKQLSAYFLVPKPELTAARLMLAKSLIGITSLPSEDKEKRRERTRRKKLSDNLDALISAYLRPEAPYGCFLFLKNSKTCDTFVQEYWPDLRKYSENFLDLYCNAAYDAYGKNMRNKIEKDIPKDMRKTACLVLWKSDDKKHLKKIGVEGLSDADICDLIRSVADDIEGQIDQIANHAQAKAKKLAQERSQTYGTHIDNNGGTVAIVSGDNMSGHISSNGREGR